MEVNLLDSFFTRPVERGTGQNGQSGQSGQTAQGDTDAPAHPFGPAVRMAIGGAASASGAGATYGTKGLTTSPGVAEDNTAAAMADDRMLQRLRQRDSAVRAKESAKGEAVLDENYTYQTGPDGKQYAVGTRGHLVKPEAEAGSSEDQNAGTPVGQDGEKLSDAEQEQLRKLEARDSHVRHHEAAHIMASGGQARGAASYEYQTGPDGKRYAVGGSVQVAVTSSPTDDADMERQAMSARRAALAVGDPSAADMRVVQQATAAANKARMRQYENVRDEQTQDDGGYAGGFSGLA